MCKVIIVMGQKLCLEINVFGINVSEGDYIKCFKRIMEYICLKVIVIRDYHVLGG
jgi:hypothetical protein